MRLLLFLIFLVSSKGNTQYSYDVINPFLHEDVVVFAENTVLEDSPFNGFPTIPFRNVLFTTSDQFADIFYPPPYSGRTFRPPFYLSQLYDSFRNFYQPGSSSNKRRFAYPTKSITPPPWKKPITQEESPPPQVPESEENTISLDNAIPLQKPEPLKNITTARSVTPVENAVPLQKPEPLKNITTARSVTPVENAVPLQKPEPLKNITTARSVTPAENAVPLQKPEPLKNITTARSVTPVENAVPLQKSEPLKNITTARSVTPPERNSTTFLRPLVKKIETEKSAMIQTYPKAMSALTDLIQVNVPPPIEKNIRQPTLEVAKEIEEKASSLKNTIDTTEELPPVIMESARAEEKYANNIAHAIKTLALPKATPPLNELSEKESMEIPHEQLNDLNEYTNAPPSFPCTENLSLDENHQMQWNPGCRTLAANPIPEDKIDILFDQCLYSLQEKILEGKSVHSIKRARLLKNMMDETKINPTEQRFLAMIFTSFGETRGWLEQYESSEKKSQQERFRYQRIMKVIDNRTDKISQQQNDRTPMDTVLTPWQFSIYNAGDPNLLKIIDFDGNPLRKRSMKNAVRAYVQYENNNRSAPPITEQIFHFVANTYYQQTKNNSKKWYYEKPPFIPPKDVHHTFFKLENSTFPHPYKNDQWLNQYAAKNTILLQYGSRRRYAFHQKTF